VATLKASLSRAQRSEAFAQRRELIPSRMAFTKDIVRYYDQDVPHESIELLAQRSFALTACESADKRALGGGTSHSIDLTLVLGTPTGGDMEGAFLYYDHGAVVVNLDSA